MPPPLLSTLAEWQDLAPLQLPEDSHAAVDIQYSPEYRDTFGLLYAAICNGEKSARVLDLTERCIFLCGAHYTAWDYRFRCLEALDWDMDQEWAVCLAIAEANAKSYQIWNHRRRCALRMGAANAPREMEFAAHFLRQDGKNYHIWAHRQALVAEFGGELWAEELRFCEQMLQTDVRNNSAWAQRAFLTRHALASLLRPPPAGLLAESALPSTAAGSGRPLQADEPSEDAAFVAELRAVLTRETEFVRRALTAVPHNESGWNYLLGLEHVLTDTALGTPPPPPLSQSSSKPQARGSGEGTPLDAAEAAAPRDGGATQASCCESIAASASEMPLPGVATGPSAGPSTGPPAGTPVVTTPVSTATVSTRLVPVERRWSSAAAEAASPPPPSPLLAAVTTTTITTLTPPLPALLGGAADAEAGAGRDCSAQLPSPAVLDSCCKLLDGAVFAAALEVLAQKPDCVPARSALMQQYVRTACRLRRRGAVAAAAKAEGCAAELCEGLVVADPMHANWYLAMRDAVDARCK